MATNLFSFARQKVKKLRCCLAIAYRAVQVQDRLWGVFGIGSNLGATFFLYKALCFSYIVFFYIFDRTTTVSRDVRTKGEGKPENNQIAHKIVRKNVSFSSDIPSKIIKLLIRLSEKM